MQGSTLCLLQSPYHCQWVTGDLTRSEGYKTEEKQFGIAVVGRITFCPTHD